MAKPASLHASLHENYARASQVRGSNDRSFGVFFAILFAILGIFPVLHDAAPYYWILAVSTALFIIALLRPQLLAPLNRWWLQLGMLLHRIGSPLVLALIFYGVVLPTGLLLRLFGKLNIPTGFEPDRDSYWIPREPPGPAAQGMKNQF